MARRVYIYSRPYLIARTPYRLSPFVSCYILLCLGSLGWHQLTSWPHRQYLWSCMNRAARINYVYVQQIAGKHITYWLINLLRLTNTHEHTTMRLHSNIVCPRRMPWLNILWLLLSISGGGALKLKKYVASIKEKDVWPQYIYKTVAFNRKPFVRKFCSNLLLQ